MVIETPLRCVACIAPFDIANVGAFTRVQPQVSLKVTLLIKSLSTIHDGTNEVALALVLV